MIAVSFNDFTGPVQALYLFHVRDEECLSVMTDMMQIYPRLPLYKNYDFNNKQDKKMKAFILPLIVSGFLLSTSVNAAAVKLPRTIIDVKDGSEQICGSEDVKDGTCSLIDVSDDDKYALLSSPGGSACYDPYLIVVNLTTGKGKMMDYNRHATCNGAATAKFIRSPENSHLTVVIYDPSIKKNVGLNTINF
ncbi:TPA: hypothetical protein ACIYQ4_004368 [Escherichia coli]|uniref:hypothetical protein n=1 Tax=Escherichia coli TaxID=562 RepID=UPI002077531F|nr:hypothetical protein [Escherichia coli]MCN3349593.1 hypothetical protein [Escherichia coli]MCN5431514.1 hypothetical protein [Escherichia coli]